MRCEIYVYTDIYEFLCCVYELQLIDIQHIYFYLPKLYK